MQGSIFTKADTDPVINGASYSWENEDGTVLEGIILGVTRTPVNGGTKTEVDGNLYTFNRGPLPFHVREGTTSFAGWKLEMAPSKSAADYIRGKAEKAKKTKTED